MKNALLTKTLTAGFLIGIAVCTYLIVQNKALLQREVSKTPTHLLNHLATKLVTERVAHVHVIALTDRTDKSPASITLGWRERLSVDVNGQETFGEASNITVGGTQPRFEALIMEFSKDQSVEALALGSGSLILFRRVYSESVAPNDGFSFAASDHPVPAIYATSEETGEEEKELWRRFWKLATDPAAADAEGIKVRQVARSIATTLETNRDYRVTVEAGGRIQIKEIN